MLSQRTLSTPMHAHMYVRSPRFIHEESRACTHTRAQNSFTCVEACAVAGACSYMYMCGCLHLLVMEGHSEIEFTCGGCFSFFAHPLRVVSGCSGGVLVFYLRHSSSRGGLGVVLAARLAWHGCPSNLFAAWGAWAPSPSGVSRICAMLWRVGGIRLFPRSGFSGAMLCLQLRRHLREVRLALRLPSGRTQLDSGRMHMACSVARLA